MDNSNGKLSNGAPTTRYPEYVNIEYGAIGKAASTKDLPNTAQYFNFWISAGIDSLELGNIVGAVTDDGHITFGTVVELRSIMDIESFLSDYISHDFGDPAVNPPSDLAEITIAKVNVIRASHDRIRPIGRAVVYYASPDGIGFALGMGDYSKERGVPIGVMENGDGSFVPIFLDDEFLVGPEGSHMNMSGISGLATKTSLVEFLLKSILEKLIKTEKRKVAAVFFNVKGKDLLYLDKPNPVYERVGDPYVERCRRMYDVMGIEIAPFENVRVFAPYDRRFEGHTKSFRRDGKVEHFIWELSEIVEDIPTLFDHETWDESVEAVYVDVRDQIERQPIRSYDELITWINEERRVVAQSHITHWRGHEKEDFYKCAKNLDALTGLYDGLICTGGVDPVDIPLQDLYNGSIFVIDLQSLNDRGQAMVFNKILMRTYKMLLDKDSQRDFNSVVFFIDELNKFAPNDPNVRAPIKQSLIEICARGRSIGVSLFGVEQFMSQIDRQVVDNSSTIIYGRTGHAELMTTNYSWLDVDMRNRLTTVPRGTFLLKHAKFVQPVFCKFPFPTCVPGDQYEEEDIVRERDAVSAFSFRRDL